MNQFDILCKVEILLHHCHNFNIFSDKQTLTRYFDKYFCPVFIDPDLNNSIDPHQEIKS
jgi:hypothetical protein